MCTGEFCENLCRCNRILSPQQVAQIQSDLIFCDLFQRQNSVAETEIFTKILQYTEAICRCDVSPHLVAATSRRTCSHGVICRRDVLLQLVALCVPTFKISLINAPCLIDTPGENYSKLLGISKNEQNHSLHSVSCLINKALRISSCLMSSLN